MESFGPQIGDIFLTKIETVRFAVEKKQPLYFLYQGHHRSVSPFMLGKVLTKDANVRYVVHGFQFGGGSSKGTIESPEKGEWRFFYLDQMNEIPMADVTPERKWFPKTLAKSEGAGEYKPPAFITEVLALHPKE